MRFTKHPLFEPQVIKALAGGLKSYLPKANDFRGTGGSDNSDYCYAVWYRHFFYLAQQDIDLQNIDHLLELGPGDSLGVSMAAYLAGAKHVTALDVVDHINRDLNLKIAVNMLEIFKEQPRDLNQLFPMLSPSLPNHQSGGLPWQKDRESQLFEWADAFKEKNLSAADPISYLVSDWIKEDLELKKLDLILAQSVFQYLDLDLAFKKFHSWLKPEGIISTQVDYSSMGICKNWNGHWALPNWAWSFMQGRRPVFAKRLTHSEFKKTAEQNGFEILFEKPECRGETLAQDSELFKNTKYASYPATDFKISHSHWILKKK